MRKRKETMLVLYLLRPDWYNKISIVMDILNLFGIPKIKKQQQQQQQQNLY